MSVEKDGAIEGPAFKAVSFESSVVYRSAQKPGYTSWVSFFPGERGQWYLACEEVTRPQKPLPKCTRQQWYEMGIPVGYDKSQYRMEMVILESTDSMKSWKPISRVPCRFHHSAGSFGQASTRDGRFLRFVWSMYSLDPSIGPNQIYYLSKDDGKSWEKMPPFHNPRFASATHRLRMLRDGTLVVAVPLLPRYGKGTDRPIRTCMNLDAIGECAMNLFFSYDQGLSWDGPLPILSGQNASETDFVELPDGNLLVANNSIWPQPGRQIIYREGTRWTPGPLEKARGRTRWNEPNRVPETICLTDDGVLVGCLRAGHYGWSDDLGLSWQPLSGIPEIGPEVYQPWIHYLGNNRIACAGHLGLDDPIGKRDQCINLHLITVQRVRATRSVKMELDRDFDQKAGRWKNSFAIRLTSDGAPVIAREVEVWYVRRDEPGYVSFNRDPLEARIKMGGRLILARTGEDGVTRVSLPEMDLVTDPHFGYQLVALFDRDGKYPESNSAQSFQFTFYAFHPEDPPLSAKGGAGAAKSSG